MQNRQNYPVDVRAELAASAVGYAATKAAREIGSIANLAVGYNQVKASQGLSRADITNLEDLAEHMAWKNNIYDKLKVQLYTKEHLKSDKFQAKFEREIKLSENLKKTVPNDILRNLLVSNGAKSNVYSYVVGVNAGFDPDAGKIKIAESFLAALPHEVGHAIQVYGGGIRKFVAQARGFLQCNRATSRFMILAMMTQKPSEESSKDTSPLRKANDFIRKHATLIMGALVLPRLADEAGASIIAGKYAKRLLSPELYAKVRKTNALGFLSYLCGGAIEIAALHAGLKAKDKAVDKFNKFFEKH